MAFYDSPVTDIARAIGHAVKKVVGNGHGVVIPDYRDHSVRFGRNPKDLARLRATQKKKGKAKTVGGRAAAVKPTSNTATRSSSPSRPSTTRVSAPGPKASKPKRTTQAPAVQDDLGTDLDGYANDMADLEYGSSISDLLREMDRERAAAPNRITQATDWYNQLARTMAQGAQADSEATAHAVSDMNSGGAGLLNLIGGEASAAAPGLAQSISNSVAGLQGLGLSQQNFNTNMSNVVNLERAGSLRQIQSDSIQSLQDMAAALANLRRERGQAATKYRADREQQLFDNQMAQENLNLAKQLSPLQVQEQRLKNQGLATQNTAAGLANKQAQLDYDTTMAQFKRWQSEAGQADPAEQAKLADRLWSSIVGPQGNPKYKVNRAFGIVGSLLQEAGLDINDPKNARLRRLVLGRVYPGLIFGAQGNPAGYRR